MIWGIKNETTGVMMVGDDMICVIKQAVAWRSCGHKVISVPSLKAKRMFNI